jgi:hypothetical protein
MTPLFVVLAILAAPSQATSGQCFTLPKKLSATEMAKVVVHGKANDPRIVQIVRTVDGASETFERLLGAGEREFRFRFSRSDAGYSLTLLTTKDGKTGPPLDGCRTEPVRSTDESGKPRPSFLTALVGLGDGLGLEVGAAAWVKRIGLAGGVIPVSVGESTWKATGELAFRGNRGINGVGYRYRAGLKEIGGPEHVLYTHMSLELPGVQLGTIWSGWIGLEVQPLTRDARTHSWKWGRGLALRLQLRTPRDR